MFWAEDITFGWKEFLGRKRDGHGGFITTSFPPNAGRYTVSQKLFNTYYSNPQNFQLCISVFKTPLAMVRTSIVVCTFISNLPLLLTSPITAGASDCASQKQSHYCTTVMNRQCQCSFEISPPCQWLCTGPELPPNSPNYGMDMALNGELDFETLEAWEAALDAFIDI